MAQESSSASCDLATINGTVMNRYEQTKCLSNLELTARYADYWDENMSIAAIMQ